MAEHRSDGRRRSDDSLRQSEDRYRRLVDLSPDAVLIVQDGKVIFANPAATNLLGAGDVASVVGREALEFLHPAEHRVVAARMAEVLDGERQAVFKSVATGASTEKRSTSKSPRRSIPTRPVPRSRSFSGTSPSVRRRRPPAAKARSASARSRNRSTRSSGLPLPTRTG
jgi:PAS domain-containing protein